MRLFKCTIVALLALTLFAGGVQAKEKRGGEPVNSATGCGLERWSLKTGTDAGASKVNVIPQWTSVWRMVSLPRPASIPRTGRLAPTETHTYYLTAYLTRFKMESDSDVHLVLQGSTGRTMIAEIPAPDCVGSTSPFLGNIQNARNAFDAVYTPSSSWQASGMKVKVTGVGFYDFLHGQSGVAPNGVELHPVTSIVFAP